VAPMAALLPSLPVALSTFLDTALSFDKVHRFADGRAMQTALREVLASLEAPAKEVGTIPPEAKAVIPKRGMARTLAGILAAGAIAVAALAMYASSTTGPVAPVAQGVSVPTTTSPPAAVPIKSPTQPEPPAADVPAVPAVASAETPGRGPSVRDTENPKSGATTHARPKQEPKSAAAPSVSAVVAVPAPAAPQAEPALVPERDPLAPRR
jgi:hypothetical protein